jgi:hypothetical protein
MGDVLVSSFFCVRTFGHRADPLARTGAGRARAVASFRHVVTVLGDVLLRAGAPFAAGVIKSTTLTPPMSKQWGLHVHERKRLPEQRIVEMIYLSDRKIIRNPPIHVDTLSLRNSSAERVYSQIESSVQPGS